MTTDVLLQPRDESQTAPRGRLFLVRDMRDTVPEGAMGALNQALNLDNPEWFQAAQAQVEQIMTDLPERVLSITVDRNVESSLVVRGLAAAALLKDYGYRSGDSHLRVAGDVVSTMRARVFMEYGLSRGLKPVPILKKVVDLQIKTSADKPTRLYTPVVQPDGSKGIEVPSRGSWFTFPLGNVCIEEE